MILQRIFISHNFVMTQAKIQFKSLLLNLTNIFDQRQFFDPRHFSEVLWTRKTQATHTKV